MSSLITVGQRRIPVDQVLYFEPSTRSDSTIVHFGKEHHLVVSVDVDDFEAKYVAAKAGIVNPPPWDTNGYQTPVDPAAPTAPLPMPTGFIRPA